MPTVYCAAEVSPGVFHLLDVPVSHCVDFVVGSRTALSEFFTFQGVDPATLGQFFAAGFFITLAFWLVALSVGYVVKIVKLS